MNEDVAVATVVDERLGGGGVAGDHYGPVRSLESEAEGIHHVLVPRRECRYRDIVILEDNAGHDLLRIHLAATRTMSVDAVSSHADVHLPSLQHMLSHGLDARRATDR